MVFRGMVKRVILISLIFSSAILNAEPKYFGAVFGDSLAYTVGAFNRKNSISACLTRKTGLSFGNFGVNGATTHDALEFLKWILAANPKIVLISLGGNDVIGYLNDVKNRKTSSRFNESATHQNLTKIYEQLKTYGMTAIHLGISPPRVPENKLSMMRDGRLERIRETALKSGALFMDNFMTDLWLNKSLMRDDRHPNDNGAKIQCERILEYLKVNKLL